MAGSVRKMTVDYPVAARVVGWLGVAFVTSAAALAALTAASWAYGTAESVLALAQKRRLAL